VILLLSRLSFLGLGVQPPLADWGSLVRLNLAGFVYGAPAVIAPAIAIASLTIGVNLIIDSLQLRRPSAMEGQ
jgi:peptide/nickel transport system permease protein